jgi:hypothetical protein
VSDHRLLLNGPNSFFEFVQQVVLPAEVETAFFAERVN